MDERMYWLAWSLLPGMDGNCLLAIAAHFGSLERAWRATPAALASVPGLGRAAAQGVLARNGVDPAAAWAAANRPPGRVVTWLDDDFPAPLRQLPDPPAVLYLRGTLPPWEHAVAVVGMRSASDYGTRVARRLGRELAALGAVVVSGVAAGIDRQAHEGALDVPAGLTVGVLGCGFDHVYPRGHRELYRAIAERGALLSEHRAAEGPTRYSFPRRNRLIAGLSRGVIVVEARRKSGSLITADLALEQGLPVFAVPGPIESPGSEGPHDLLRQGARLLASVDDVLDELGWARVPVVQAEQPHDPLQRAVLALLGPEARHVDALAAASGLGPGVLGAALLALECAGLIDRLAGQRYRRI